MSKPVALSDSRSFRRSILLALGFLVLGVVSFPFLMIGLATLTDCSGVGGACGALGVVGAVVLLPLLLIAFVWRVAVLTVRRLRDWGLPRWYALFPASLLVVSSSGLAAAMAPGALVAMGAPFGGPLFFLPVFVALVVALAIAPSTIGGSPFRADAKWLDHATGFGIALVGLACLATPIGGLVAQFLPGSRRLGIVAMYGYGNMILLVALVVAGLWIFAAIRDRRTAAPRIVARA